MVLQFTKDPQTGVVVPPVTVFNGGKRSKKMRKTRKSKKTRKTSKKSRKTTRR